MADQSRSLGGPGALNLPFEDVPGGPIQRPPSNYVLASGLVVLSALVTHPITKRPHPVLLFRFALPSGEALPEVLLLVEWNELTGLEKLTTDAIHSAKNAARKAGVA